LVYEIGSEFDFNYELKMSYEPKGLDLRLRNINCLVSIDVDQKYCVKL
jgi:hypothetical protein